MKKVTAQQLDEGMVLAQDVYAGDESAGAILLKGATLTARAIDRLRNAKIDEIYVEGEDDAPRAASLRQMAQNTVQRVQPIVTKQLRGEAIATLETLFAGVEKAGADFLADRANAQPLNSVVDKLVESVEQSESALLDISELKSYDDYTYHHSLSVALLALGLGQQMNISGKKLKSLALCAILHDIGKTAVPVEIIRKPARLNAHEFNIVMGHSSAGFSHLTQGQVGDEEIWRGVLHHHEKFDGTGYPNHLRGIDIPLYSRIISVADVYDALTSNRPYRTPMQPAQAIEYVMGGVGSSFDFDVVSALVSRVDMYPKGSVVELSNGGYALVLDTQNQMRPVVELLGSGQVVDLYRDRSFLNVVVVRVVPEDEA